MISGELFELIYQTGYYFTIFCLLTGIALYRHQPRLTRIILLYLLLSITSDFLAKYLVRWFQLSTNYHIINLWTLVEYITISYFFFQVEELRKYKTLQILAFVGFIGSYLIGFLFFISIYELTNFYKFFESLIFCIQSIVLYYRFTLNLDTELTRTPMFWQNTGLFIFFTGTLLIFLMIDFLFADNFAFLNIGFVIHNLLTIIKTLCFLIAIYVNYRIKPQR